MQTIFAQSSRPGKAGVALFRISGTLSLYALKKLLLSEEYILTPRHIYYKNIYDPESQSLIDNAMMVLFPAPASFTGEDVVEIYTHGSIAIAKMLISALLKIEGLRIAEPGEFTRRAFLNNKFDLTGAEGIADLIEAETALQHKQAIKQMGGALQKFYDNWRKCLLNIISLLEAYIDFPDEEIPQSVLNQVQMTITKLVNEINTHLNDNRRGELMRSGIKLSIIGVPNVGKSSLINLLCQRNIAIVSDIAGTTRDIIETHLDIGGYPIILQDTAGIRGGSADIIEQEGINRAIYAAQNADIKIIMVDALQPSLPDNLTALMDKNTIFVVNKIDLISEHKIENDQAIYISITQQTGLDSLLRSIESMASKITQIAEESPPITRERHRHQLQQALIYLQNCNINDDLVLATEDIRMTIRLLGNITGKITVDEILGEIFGNFCIGK